MNKKELIVRIVSFFHSDILALDSKAILRKESISLSLWVISISLIVFLSVLTGLFVEDFSVYWHLLKNLITMFFLIFFLKKIDYNHHKLRLFFRNNLRDIRKHLLVFIVYGFVFLSLIFIFSFFFELTSKVFGTEKIIGEILMDSPSAFLLDLEYKFLHKKFDFYIYAFSLCVLTPVVEEILYRRFLYVALRKRFSFKFSTFFCSLIFSFFHFPEIVVSFLGGCFLCYVYEREENLFVPIMIHSMKNLIVVFIVIFGG